MPQAQLREAIVSHPLFTKTRLYSLYSDFRKLKELNPEGFEANLIAWKSFIDLSFQESLHRHTFILETDGLVEDLTLAEYGKPIALDFVLEELIKSGDLIPYKSYMQEKKSIYSQKWVQPVVSWAINRYLFDTSYKLGAKNNGLKSDRLISKKTLEKYTDALLKTRSKEDTSSKCVFTIDQFKEYIQGLNIALMGKAVHVTELDYEVLMKYLERDANQIRTDEDYVKFGTSEITEEDKGIAHIKSTIDIINKKNQELTTKIDDVTLKLKKSLKSGNKEMAKNLLRSKKIAEQSLAKQISSLTQLESVLFKIDESSTNLQLISALESGSALLKSLNTQIGGIDRVEALMDELEEQKVQSDEITEEITRLGGSAVDNDEVDEEFDRILKEETEKRSSAVVKTKEDELVERLNKLKLAPSELKEAPLIEVNRTLLSE